MPYIKTKPQMDQPKTRVVNNAPKDAGTILKKEYAAQQKEKQQDTKGPVQHATDRVETAGRRGTVAATDGVRRMIKKAGGQSRVNTANSNAQAQERLGNGGLSGKNGGSSLPFTLTPQGNPSHSAAPKQEKAAPVERGRQLAVRSAKKRRKRAPNLAEKENAAANTAGRVFSPKTEKGTSTAMPRAAGTKQGSVIWSRPASPTGQTAETKARQEIQRKAQKKRFVQTVAGAKETAQKGGQMIVQAAAVVGRAVASTFEAITVAGGGVALLVMLMGVILTGAIAASPFGILFSGENTTSDTVPISAAIAQVQYDFNAQLEALQTADTYDDVTLTGELPDWTEVIAVFAVKVAGSDGADAADVVTIDSDRIGRLKTIFGDMCRISNTVDVTEHPDSDPDDGVNDSWTEKVLNITITPKSAEEMKVSYGFTTRQITAMEELLAQRDLLLELVGSLASVSTQSAEIIRNLPEDLSPERREVVKTACSLVGKVNYFWGGKSHAIGWDSRWGQLYEVTAADSPTTGTYRPYGMDCSGFVDWVFNNALGYVIGHGGGAHTQHTYCEDIAWSDAQPGDLVFYPDDKHVGIVAEIDDSGELLVIHCTSSYNNVVITNNYGFAVLSRPCIFA